LVFLVLVAPHAVRSGDWKVTDDISLTSTYVDRNGDDTEDSESGLVFELSPRWTVRGRGGRVTADINYSPNLAYGTSDTNPKTLTHDLFARGQVEVVENEVFIGGNASAGVRNRDSAGGRRDAINFDAGGQQYFSSSVNARTQHRLNQYANLTSGASTDFVDYSEGDSGSSRGFNAQVALASGRFFGRTDWRLSGTYRETDFDDRDDTRKNVDATVGYRIDARLRVSGSVGYEDNDVQTDRIDTSGPTWDVGADWTPSPRTSLSASYGDRYFGKTWSGNISHRSRRTRLGLNFSRDIDNRRNEQLVDSFFFLVDENGDIITDPSTGIPIIANIPQPQETDEDFLNTQVRGIVTLTGARTSVNVISTISRREYEVSDEDEDSFDVRVNVSRRLGGNYSGSLRTAFRTTDRDDRDDATNYDVGLSLSKTYSRRTSASLNYDYFNDEDFTEHRIGLTLRANLL
jgi:uncharacterized protein (PEP-CTERM system associated)